VNFVFSRSTTLSTPPVSPKMGFSAADVFGRCFLFLGCFLVAENVIGVDAFQPYVPRGAIRLSVGRRCSNDILNVFGQNGAEQTTQQLDPLSHILNGSSGGGGNGNVPEDEENDEEKEPMLQVADFETLLEILVPLAAPLVAFFTYEDVARVFSSLLDVWSSNTWIPVDGGALQAKIIGPAINGE